MKKINSELSQLILRSNTHKITKDMIDNLSAMIISNNDDDKNLAMNILNNRDINDPETEANVKIIFEAYAKKYMPDLYTKVIMPNRINNKMKDTLQMINRFIEMEQILTKNKLYD